MCLAVAGVAAVVQGVNEHCAVHSRLRWSWGKWCEASAAPATAAAAVVTESPSRSCDLFGKRLRFDAASDVQLLQQASMRDISSPLEPGAVGPTPQTMVDALKLLA